MWADNRRQAFPSSTVSRLAKGGLANIWLICVLTAASCTTTAPCNPCATAVSMDVVDSAGKPIANAVLQGVTGAGCENGRCFFPLGDKARVLHLGVSAEGYASTDFDFAITANASTEPCACPLAFAFKTVTLVKI